MKMNVFWDVAPRSLEEVYHRFKGAYCLLLTTMSDGETSQKTVIFIPQ
jgi:hypothetical protein